MKPRNRREYDAAKAAKPCSEPKGKSLWQQLKAGLLGDVTETILTSVGLTKSRWEQIIGGPCGCGERQAWLNKVGQALIGERQKQDNINGV
jgi:hypothetical protein